LSRIGQQPLLVEKLVEVAPRATREIGGLADLGELARPAGLAPAARRRDRASGSVIVNRRSAARFSNVCTWPLGHVTVSA
jgi:hypothetical protein